MRLSLLLLLCGALVSIAPAQLFPPVPKQGTVYDGANLLTDAEERSISDLSQRFQQSTGAPIVVATLPSLDKMEAKSMGIEKYSTELFNQWRIGNRNANSGILLVVAKEDRKARIELGRDWQHDYDAKAQSIMRGTIVPAFKQGQLSKGILSGCDALSHLADQAGAAGPQGPPIDQTPFGAPFAQTMDDTGDAIGGLICIGAPVLFIILAIAFAAGRRRRYNNGYGGGAYGPNSYNNVYDDPRDDSGAFIAGVATGQMMSQPTYDPPSYDSGSSFDSSSDSGSSFDSGDSGGGGSSGDW